MSEATRSIGSCDPPDMDRQNQHASREVEKGRLKTVSRLPCQGGFADVASAASHLFVFTAESAMDGRDVPRSPAAEQSSLEKLKV